MTTCGLTSFSRRHIKETFLTFSVKSNYQRENTTNKQLSWNSQLIGIVTKKNNNKKTKSETFRVLQSNQFAMALKSYSLLTLAAVCLLLFSTSEGTSAPDEELDNLRDLLSGLRAHRIVLVGPQCMYRDWINEHMYTWLDWIAYLANCKCSIQCVFCMPTWLRSSARNEWLASSLVV